MGGQRERADWRNRERRERAREGETEEGREDARGWRETERKEKKARERERE